MSKKATWVGRETRSEQYYLCRDGWEWAMSEKTRDPAEAMQHCWGDDVSVVDMLGLEPQKAERGWERFKEAREIVDAGRNYREARRLMRKLEDQAEAEEGLAGQAEEHHVDSVKNEIEQRRHEADEHVKELQQALKNDGLFGLLEHWQFDHAVRGSVFALALNTDTKKEDCDNVERMQAPELREWLKKQREDYVYSVLDAPRHGSQGDLLVAAALQIHGHQVTTHIDDWIDRLDRVIDARETFAKREKARDGLEKLLKMSVKLGHG